MRKAELELQLENMTAAAKEYRALWEGSDEALRAAMKACLLAERDSKEAREQAAYWEKAANDNLDSWEAAMETWQATKRDLEQQLKEALDAAWLAERKRVLSLDYQALPAFYEANTHCPKCGSSNLGTNHVEKVEPRYGDGIVRRTGNNEYVRHYCADCGAYLMRTKVLEAGRG